MTEPSTGEIARRLDQLAQQLRDLPATLDAAYLRRETYMADQRADSVQLRGLEAEVRSLRDEIKQMDHEARDERQRRDAESATNRRLIVTAFIAPIVVAIVTAIVLGGVLP